MRYCKSFVLFIFLLFSCGKETVEAEAFLTITPLTLTIQAEAGASNSYYTVQSDRSVKVSSNQSGWCLPMLSNVSFDNLKIAITANETFVSREAVVTVSNSSESMTITVKQAGKQPLLTVNKSSVLLQHGETQFNLEVTSTIRFTVECPTWIQMKEGNAWQEGKQIYTFTLSDLPDEMLYREGMVNFTPDDDSGGVLPLSVQVMQKGLTKVIAHRGYWRSPDYPQNSLASLQRAFDLEIYGSELDVWITKDGVVVLNHDATISGINIENSNYTDLKDVRLTNGEPIPTLQECIDRVKKQGKTKLVIEIKPHATTANENRAVAAVLELVNNNGVAHQVDYISFSQNICRGLIVSNPGNRVAYLNGNLTPDVLKSQGYWGLDYSSGVLKSNTGWVQSAKAVGLTVNVWTVNTTPDFEYFITMGVDFITTDSPQMLKEMLASYK
jgi:glycerophosphoryl diester phosphodiesterase